MKLTGKLKKLVENAKTREEAREAIKNAGMLLDDDELEEVCGGDGIPIIFGSGETCPVCGQTYPSSMWTLYKGYCPNALCPNSKEYQENQSKDVEDSPYHVIH
jgi:DNA repair exonuclease SbcCD ATPase subunit